MFEGGESYRGVGNWLGGVGYGVNVYGAWCRLIIMTWILRFDFIESLFFRFLDDKNQTFKGRIFCAHVIVQLFSSVTNLN